ncbi:MAG: hypothetical protein HS111_00925 [Kofleriaceae bacterium]|nr:hypothetical protein [Kofleriaceae bacterium]MCL4226137.1 hypothetical protein [Myxococcales bacterium]
MRQGSSERQKAVKILARSLYRQLTQEGYDDKQIVALATELLSEVTSNIAAEQVAARDAATAAVAIVR